MSKINNAIYEIHHIDQIASRDQWMNQIHPLVKLCLTIIYIAVTVSFSKYDIVGLSAMAVYLFIAFHLAELSFRDALRRLRVVLPIVCVVGIANPFFDRVPVAIGVFHVNAGVLSMLTLMMKGVFAVLASYILIATTTIEKICYALRLLHIPTILVTQILLTYRYITLLLGEVNRITQAYALRAPNQKGIHFKVWGSLTGQLLLRSIDRANDVYDSMTLRGYHGEFRYVGEKYRLRSQDALYFIVWIALFALFRKIPILIVIGNLVGGLFA
ncbi:MAG: cobalt ECF transporter T component CbiQ [Eubacteriales bacterium]|nr:cobalt ECF transporter T component CbiQ [Eubacteriales bacterium]